MDLADKIGLLIDIFVALLPYPGMQARLPAS
jgi:hypothetical protein